MARVPHALACGARLCIATGVPSNTAEQGDMGQSVTARSRNVDDTRDLVGSASYLASVRFADW